MKRPAPPPGFNQEDHYFPALFNKYNDINKAYTECCNMSQNSLYPNTAIKHCRLDAMSVVPVNKENYKENYKKKPIKRTVKSSPNTSNYYNDNKNANPIAFFIGFFVVILMILTIVWFYANVLMNIEKS